MSILVYFFSDYIVLFLYGSDFIESSSLLMVHIFSAIFVYLGVSSGRWLINENKTLLNLYRNLIGLCINIVLNIYLIKIYGNIGAAVASLSAYIFAFYIFDFFHKDMRKLFFLKTQALFLKGIK